MMEMIPQQTQSRYMVTKLDSGDYVVADSKTTDPKMYLLTVEHVGHEAFESKTTNTRIRLGYFDPRPHVGHNCNVENDIQIQHLIWESEMYLRKESAARSVVQKVLIVLEQEEVEIDHPYELTYKFGGTITP